MEPPNFIHLPDPYPNELGAPDDILKRKAFAGLKKHLAVFKEQCPRFSSKAKEYKNRLDSELMAIKEAGFANYLLVAADIVDYAHSHDIPVGPGRGCAAGSLVNFALNITKLDPLEHGLLFEMFLARGPDYLPRIDIEFCGERQPEIVRYVTRKYGKTKVKQLAHTTTPRLRATVREVGRILRLSPAKISEICKLIPLDSRDLGEAIEREPKLQRMTAHEPQVSNLFQIAIRVEGQVHFISANSAGSFAFVLADKPIKDFLPLYQDLNNAQPPVHIFAHDEAKMLGLAVYNFIGLGILTKINLCLKLVKEKHGREIDLDFLPLDDKRTWELLARGDTDGIFLLEAEGVKQLLLRLKPRNIDQLAAVHALYRPGPLARGVTDSYICRKKGLGKIPKIHPVFDELTKETLGLVLYQEQALMILHRFVGFSMDEAIAFFKDCKNNAPQARTKFLQRCSTRKQPKAKAIQIIDQIIKFAPSAFLKAHAVCCALISYRTAWLKANYPGEFMASFFRGEQG